MHFGNKIEGMWKSLFATPSLEMIQKEFNSTINHFLFALDLNEVLVSSSDAGGFSGSVTLGGAHVSATDTGAFSELVTLSKLHVPSPRAGAFPSLVAVNIPHLSFQRAGAFPRSVVKCTGERESGAGASPKFVA